MVSAKPSDRVTCDKLANTVDNNYIDIDEKTQGLVVESPSHPRISYRCLGSGSKDWEHFGIDNNYKYHGQKLKKKKNVLCSKKLLLIEKN